MKTNAKYQIGSNEEAAQTIISLFWAGSPGDEDRFIKLIPKNRRAGILEAIKIKSPHVYDEVKVQLD